VHGGGQSRSLANKLPAQGASTARRAKWLVNLQTYRAGAHTRPYLERKRISPLTGWRDRAENVSRIDAVFLRARGVRIPPP
jgi:hypothetical protein